MIAHLLRALFRAADARVDRMVAAALDDTTAVKDATAEPAPTWGDYGYRTGRAATPADLAYGDTLDPAWLLLDVEVER